MGLIEWLTGWEYVGDTLHSEKMKKIHPNIIRILERKANNVMNKRTKKYWKRKGRKIIIEPHNYISDYISGCVVHIRGKTFIYRGKESDWRFIDNQGHGGYVNSGMKIWRKLRKYR